MSRADLPSIRGKLDRDERGLEQPVAPADAAEEEAFSPYHFIHQHLRGRYLLAIGLGLLCAAAMAVVGWNMTSPMYRSEALLRIAYEQQRVLQASPDYKPMEVYEAFMQSQVALLGSSRVLSKAVEEPIWADRNIKMDASWVEALAEGLMVEHRAGTENLKVSFASSNPLFAATAVRATVDAYTKLYNEMDLQSSKERTTALESRKTELDGVIDKSLLTLRDESAEFGSSNVDRFYENAVARLTRIESSLIDVRIALAMTQPRTVGGQAPAVVRFTPQQIARFDQTMARYVADREGYEMKLQQLRMRGLGDGHKDVKETRQMLDFVAERIRDSALEFQESGAASAAAAAAAQAAPAAAASAAVPGLIGRSADELKGFEANLMQLNKEAKDQLTAVGSKKLKIEAIRAEIDKNKSELNDVVQKLSSIQIESGLSGRLSVMSNGEVPLLPFRNRRVHLAGMGAIAGLAVPAVAMVGLAFVRRRYRDSMDAADDLAKDVTLLGILPQLPARLTDPESAADAAQCLHQIRVMLQVQQPQGQVTYLLTSSCPGEGKTSLCAALALSFAAAGARTLVVDADLIGQRLTRGYRMEDKAGFREAMEGGRKSIPFYPTGVKHLSILPAGISDGRDACSVSSKMVKRLLQAVREDFDVVLVDSGPILGSLEALVLAQHVDGVIMTISREQQKPLVDRALRQLRSVKATIAGMVFNKAESADFKRSVGPSSLRSIPRNAESGMLVKAGMTSTSGFGSLVDSVQTFMPEPNPT